MNYEHSVKKRSVEELQEIALQTRKDIIQMIFESGSGHPGGSLSAVELLVALYFGILKYDPKNPKLKERDRFFLSNGHVCPALYSVLVEAGYLSEDKLSTYAKLNSPLQGHPERIKLPGIESTSGSLGMGLAQAAGYAASAMLDNKNYKIYCMVSDAEHQEGNHWEAVEFAAKYKVPNLVLIVDKNRVQIEGTTDEIMPVGNLLEKYIAWGWNAIEVKNGHDFNEIFASFEKLDNGKPNVAVANTVFGKGISFMKNNPDWHAKAPDEEEYKAAIKELEENK